MILKSATIVCLFALVQSATIQQRNIPVEVKYDEAASETAKVTTLDEKIQTELTDSASETIPEEPLEQKINAVRNLDEKVQLSPEELSQASKHVPVVEEISLRELGEIRSEQVTPSTPGFLSALQQAEDVIYSGLKKLRNSFKSDKDQQSPYSEQWDDFEKSVTEFLNEEKTNFHLKQTQPVSPQQNQNIFQSIGQGFQSVANNFVQNLVGTEKANSTNLGDEQQGSQAQGPLGGFVNFFQNGVNNLVTTINGLGSQGPTTSNTVLGDTGTATTQAPGIVSNLVNNVQQFFGQIQGAVQGSGSSGTQGDTGTNSSTSSGPQGPGQIIQSIGSAINQFIQGRPPNSSGDEGTATTESNVNIIQSIGNAIQNSPLNLFRPPQKPAEGGATTSNPIQAGISSAQNIGSQIQQLIPGQSSTTEAPKADEQVTVGQSNQTVEEASSQAPTQQAKGINLEAEEEKQKKDEVIQEEGKGEEVKQQMEEQVKQEEIKEEMRQEELREKLEEKNQVGEKKEEIMMTAE